MTFISRIKVLFAALLLMGAFSSPSFAACGFGSAIGGGQCRGFLTSPTGSNQTFTSPSDWNNANNTIELIAGGGSGGSQTGVGHPTGGGAGEYGKTTNFTFATPGTTTATYQIGAGGVAVTGATVGNNGGDTWFNGTTQAGATLGALHGVGGATGTGSRNGGTGGTGGVGTTHTAGGRGGNLTGASGSGGSGGGGAGGSTGAGNAGVDSSNTTAITTAGGSADAGSGGAGGAGGGNNPGGNGTEWDASHGSGGGGGGNGTSGTLTAGSGGNYGGGGGGAIAVTPTSGAGIQGIIVITYLSTAGGATYGFNLPIMGL